MNNERGLTLVEIVVSLTLAVVIFVILFAAMRLGYKAQQKGAEKAAVTQKHRIINERVSWLIRGIYPFWINRVDRRQIAFDGADSSVGFVTTSVEPQGTGPEDRAGLKWVMLSADNKGLRIVEKVFFSEDLYESGGGKEYILDPDVKRLGFQYYDLKDDKPEQERQPEWVDSWDTDEKKYLPAAIKVRITLVQDGVEMKLPEMLVRLNVKTAVQAKAAP